MPRTAKRSQPVRAAGDQAYGAAGEQRAAQKAIPLPDERAASPAPPPGAAPTPGGGAAPDQDPVAAMLAAAQGMEAPTPPPWAAGPVDENIHAGLPTGPGPGPEALDMAGPPRLGVADMLLRVAEATGNRYYAELAQEAAAR